MQKYRLGKDPDKYTLKGVTWFFLLYGLSLVLGFVLNYVLIRTVGSADYGVYVYIANLVALLSGFCIMGTDVLLIKQNDIYNSEKKYQHLKGVIIFSVLLTLIISLFVGVGLAVVVKNFQILNNLEWYEYGAVCFFILPFTSLIIVMQSSLQGLKKIFQSQLVERIIRPFAFLLIVFVLFLLNVQVALRELILISSAIAIVGFGIVLVLNNNAVREKLKNIRAGFEYKYWWRLSVSFFILNALSVLNSRVDIFLLGIFRTRDEVGVYNIVLKLGELSGFGLFAVNFVVAPLIPRLISGQDRVELQKLITNSVRIALAISIPVMLCLVIFGKTLLGFFHIYAEEAWLALAIICFGQLVNVFTGSVGTLLLMSNNQYYSILSLGISIVVSIVMNIALTPSYGVIGVSVAASTGLILWNVIMYYFVRRRLNINTTPFGSF